MNDIWNFLKLIAIGIYQTTSKKIGMIMCQNHSGEQHHHAVVPNSMYRDVE